ncbi:hypothetical protein HYDPIDRAFT_29036 [Hydnomerulius pinastri MD-312]|uniref:Uncharacterized protein n=1 Tax=Hydnomerulius pinastri MD-312 TaxID=994086 RepID=A0A0C9W087_9AGAM|nr:hypothetical protein HYDPIDRAFT_29036 [Hydnomerulius pinastri MD-312]
MAVHQHHVTKAKSQSPSKRRGDDARQPIASSFRSAQLPEVNPFLTALSSSRTSYIVEPWMVPVQRHLCNTAKLSLPPAPVLVLPGRQRFVQHPHSVQPSRPEDGGDAQDRGRHVYDNATTDDDPYANFDDAGPSFSDAVYFPNDHDTPEVTHLSNRHKKLNQWRRWSTEVIPSPQSTPRINYIDSH